MSARKQCSVCIVAIRSHVIYTGVTSNVAARAEHHKIGIVNGFSSRCETIKLVYVETTDDVRAAIAREKQINGWLRANKNRR